ncbi:hypothetical protein FQR65_LT05040 [Abscondita terminalis]|nr:hypothetical protein FQR65_LT05040 [Abscondita terminalis]
MKLFLFVLLPYVVVEASINDRLVGGLEAYDRQFPYQASLRNNLLVHVCGGSIVKSSWVVTAARCVSRASPSNMFVVVGTNYLTPSGSTFAITRFVIHPQYDDNTLKNNIALVRTRDRLLNAPYTAVVPLNIDVTIPGTIGVTSGWGKTSTSAPSFSTSLRYANVSAISLNECRTALPQYSIDNNELCALTRGVGGCDGDNGNPLVYNHMLIGVLSWGIPCATGKPDVYVNASAYVCWIANTTD